MDTFSTDIPLEVARAAHSGTSFVPNERALQERDDYARTLASDLEQLRSLADTDEKREQLPELFQRYREGLKARTLRVLVSRSHCLSTMITGGSNFPVARNEKKNRTADRRATELQDYRRRALAAIRRVLRPEDAPIMAGDHDAVSRLEAKIVAAEAWHASAVPANAIIRSGKGREESELVASLVAAGVPQALASELLKPDFMGRTGYAPYQLQNNSANLRRMKARLEGLREAKATPETEAQGALARLEDVPAENRIRVYFPGKPQAVVRERLKRGGFRWTPSLGCWQAYRNPATLAQARVEIGAAS